MTSATPGRLVKTENSGVRNPASYASVEQQTPPAGLSARNVQVLRLIADGLTDREIGVLLHLAEGTVASHVNSLYRRLEARNRAHAVTIGFRRQLLS